ncbi:three prime repair exonuclease 2-like [Haliotis cracherodii]|uniref:three prime repair exonuclease 2-like n=1 Tax=Haliotis cracherodii TaxID=6455 RepID=UPI0039EB2906
MENSSSTFSHTPSAMSKRKSKTTIAPVIKSFIIMDLETTGLVDVKISELCFLAVSRDDILAGGPRLPRVIDKLLICLNPQKGIEAKAQELSGLTNDMLSGQQPFDVHVAELMDAFIARLPEPVCMVAHNGIHFDFPILKTELGAIGRTLPGHVRFADTLLASRDLAPGRLSHALQNIYKKVFGRCPASSHTAEGDCVALLEILMAGPAPYLEWMDRMSQEHTSA